MASVKQTIRDLGLPQAKVDELISSMLTNKKSSLYAQLALSMKEYLEMSKRAEEGAITSGVKAVVRVPYSVDLIDMNILVNDYPEFKVEFHRRDKLLTGIGAARWYLETQAMFQKLQGHREGVIYMSDVFEHVVLRNRHYVHVCSSYCTPEAQVNSQASDRAIAAFGSRMVKSGSAKSPRVTVPGPLNEAFRRWARHDGDFNCTNRDRCLVQAPVLLLDYSQYGLSWEQHAVTIQQHGAVRAYSMVPVDDMILAQCDGYSAALGAWILFETSDDESVSFTINYDKDYLKSRRYDYSAYRHFLYTASVTYQGKTYYREFEDQRPGYLSCKTTVIDSVLTIDEDPALNRLWMSSEFSRMTALVSYELKDSKLDPTQRRNYRRDVLHVDAEVRDKVIQSARSLDVKSFTESKVLEITRMHMKKALVMAGTKFIEGDPLHQRVMRKLAHVAFVRVWDERHSGTLIGMRLRKDMLKIRGNSERGLAPLLVAYIARIVSDGITKAYDTITLVDSYETWRQRILRVEEADQLLPWFDDAYEFLEIQVATDVPGLTPFSGSYTHFDPTLPGGFLSGFSSIEEAVMSSPSGSAWVRYKVEDNLRRAAFGSSSQFEGGSGEQTPKQVLYEEVSETPATLLSAELVELTRKIGELDDITSRDETLDAEVLSREELVSETFEDFPQDATEFTNPLGLLQEFSDEFGHCAGMTRELDEQMLHTADLSISIAPNRLDVNWSAVVAHKPRDVYRPKMVTNAPPKALQSTEQTLFSLASRNTDTPLVYEPMSPEMVYETLAKPAIERYLGTVGVRKAAEYRANALVKDFKDIGDWLATRDPFVYKLLKDMDFDPSEQNLQTYVMLLKDQRKPQLTKGSAATVKPTQTLNYHPKDHVAMWSPLFRKVGKRFEHLVDHRAFVSMFKSPEDLSRELNRRMPGVEPENLHVLALDHSAYDKSQARVAKYCEMMFYIDFLGLDEDLCLEWFQGQYAGEMSSAAVGLRLFIEMQRRTGDATTALGNTVINFISFVTMLDGWNDDTMFDGFMGDDMIRFSLSKIPNLDLEQRMNAVFNFSIKEIRSSVAYYLSGFIIKVQGVWRWVPDVVKAMIKLGDPLPPDEDQINDRWISFKDRMSVFGSTAVIEATASAISEWYQMDFGKCALGISALWSLTRDFNSFRNCWESSVSRLMI